MLITRAAGAKPPRSESQSPHARKACDEKLGLSEGVRQKQLSPVLSPVRFSIAYRANGLKNVLPWTNLCSPSRGKDKQKHTCTRHTRISPPVPLARRWKRHAYPYLKPASIPTHCPSRGKTNKNTHAPDIHGLCLLFLFTHGLN